MFDAFAPKLHSEAASEKMSQ